MIKALSLILATGIFIVAGVPEKQTQTKQEPAKQKSKAKQEPSKKKNDADDKKEVKKDATDSKMGSEESSAIDLTGIKCIKNAKRNASLDFAAAYRDAEVFFCCDNCKEAFEKTPDPLSTKANHQLLLTKQFVQSACPISGGEIDPSITLGIGGVEVAFCCAKCQEKVKLAKGLPAKSKLVFADKPFESAFTKKPAEIKLEGVKCFLMPKRDVVKDHAVDYRDAKVYFCCQGCPKRFSKDTTKYAVQANHHLVQTGQYEQTKCPFSGSDVVDGNEVTVKGVTVGLCCGKCKKKVENAADDDARAKLLFEDKAFENGFALKK